MEYEIIEDVMRWKIKGPILNGHQKVKCKDIGFIHDYEEGKKFAELMTRVSELEDFALDLMHFYKTLNMEPGALLNEMLEKYGHLLKAVNEMEYSTDKCKKNMSHVASYCNSCGTCHDCLEAGIKSLQKELAEVKVELHAADLELAELRAELKETDMLIQKLYDKTRGKQPF